MSSNKDTTANSQNDENTQINNDETTIIEEYTLDENFQNEPENEVEDEVEDELEDINEEDMDGDTNEQNDNKNTNEFVVDDVDDPENVEISINENLERIKNLSKNKFVFNNDVNNDSETLHNDEDDDNAENIDNNDLDDQQENDVDDNNNNDINEDQNSDVDINEDQNSDDDVDYELNNDANHVDSEENNKEETSANGRKKRGLPKTMLANQQKYLEALERQQRMISSKKDKNKNQKNGKKNKNRIEEEIPKKSVVTTQPPGTRRVIVAGKVKYLPIKSEDSNDAVADKKIPPKQEISNTKSTRTSLQTKTHSQIKNTNTKTNTMPKQKETKQYVNTDENDDDIVDIPIFKKENKQTIKQTKQTFKKPQNKINAKNIKETIPSKVVQISSKTNINKTKENNNKLSKILHDNDDMTEHTKKLPPSLAKKMQIHKTVIAKQIPNIKKNKMGNGTGKKIPSKYAKQIENDVKKQTVKNVKNFSDLRRIKALQDISHDTDIDANKASIIELRKLRLEQRKKEQAELKKRAEANKRDSAIQDILRNDKMSKFAKTVAIKNLSVNSRNRRIMGKQKNVEN
ncbi:hypothetical protein QJ856_gp1100 [Tupanvirus deep ocean]|uniref:Uncharacterized protein n=2 Tax=Tupanvirus TaxID=2094720 RepID=A0AC62A7M8_9VIRU|nr:hypothetical protein QJ856_gp1100 [Tupanvirus deep ocean]QKU33657.1 hypothetical protein [Tupanvirus deep ocean]